MQTTWGKWSIPQIFKTLCLQNTLAKKYYVPTKESIYIQVSESWVECLMEEYFNQSDKEKKDSLPVAPFMDRDRVTKPTAQELISPASSHQTIKQVAQGGSRAGNLENRRRKDGTEWQERKKLK